MLTLKKAEVAQASAAQLEAEHKRLLELHRTVLTRVVQEATDSGVREKFAETWVKEWRTEFTVSFRQACVTR